MEELNFIGIIVDFILKICLKKNRMTKLRWIYKTKIKSRKYEYDYFYVRINGSYKYCTQNLKDAEEYVIRYAEKNNLKNIYK